MTSTTSSRSLLTATRGGLARGWFRATLALVAGLSLSSAATATSFVMPTDSELLAKSEVVVVGRVVAADRAPTESPTTDYSVEISRVIKGFLPGTIIVVRQLGGVSPDGQQRLEVIGAPRLAVDEEFILFLEEYQSGTFRVMDQALGAFWRPDGRDVAVRTLGGAHEMRRASDPNASERRKSHLPRRFGAFVDSLEKRAQDSASPTSPETDYFIEDGSSLVGVEQAFNLTRSPAGNPPSGCPVNAGSPVRWSEFDSGSSVLLFANQGGQPGVAGGGFNEIQQALAAWKAVPGTSTNMVYAGTTPVTNAISGVDFLNSVDFEDPNDQIAGTFPSAQSGTVAVTVVFFRCEVLHAYLGGVAHTLVEIGTTTQDGTGSFFFTPSNFLEVMAHEIGHALGISHSCGDTATGACAGDASDALMRAFVHNDGRGARLNVDDRNALVSLYAAATGPGPAAPTNLVATATSVTTINVSWTDNANNEAGFALEQRVSGSSDWALTGTPPANSTSAIVVMPPQTFAEFRVRAYNNQAFSAYSNIAGATTFAPPGPCVADDTTLCLTEGRFSVTSNWTTSQGTAGQGHAVDITSDTGYFWFFDQNNVEVVVKVLDACVPILGEKFWVFAGGLTDVQVVLTVVDTETGFTRTYNNPQQTPFQPIQDTGAFDTCP